MNTKALIDGLVRQTTVLIAHVATSAGLRAPVAHVANQVFVDLTTELERQGLGQKVIADMFGLALRSYQQKLRRLSESATDQGSSLWEAVYAYLSTKKIVRRNEVLQRFSRDDEASVKSILRDLCDSGLVYRTGRAEATSYRITSAEELYAGDAENAGGLRAMLWVCVHHDGPLTFSELSARIAAPKETLEQALQQLLYAGHVSVADDPEMSGVKRYRTQDCVIPLGARQGWEAALLDHFQSVVRAMCVKLTNGETRAQPDDEVGGSTYTFDVWPGHPHEAKVRALLKDSRRRASALWDEVTTHNRIAEAARGAEGALPEPRRVAFYCGQFATIDEGPSDLGAHQPPPLD